MRYAYRARAKNGSIQEGEHQANQPEEVAAWLRGQNLMPIAVREVRRAAPAKKTSPGSTAPGKSVKTSLTLLERLQRITTVTVRDKAIFFRQLATMISSGLTLASALDILKDQTANKRLGDAIGETKRLLDGGYPLAVAMKRRKEFSPLMIAMVQAGEEGGLLDITLDRVATFLEKQDALARKIKSALTYPIVVMLFATGVLYLMVTVIVPKFQKVFAGMNAEMPRITLMVFAFADFLKYKWPFLLGGFVILMVVLVLLHRMRSTRGFVDTLKLKFPVFGDILFKAIMARTMRTLGSLVQAGVPILPSLDMTMEVANNVKIAQGFGELRDNAKQGTSLGESAKKLKIFPPMVAHMLSVGEQTGKLEEMMNKVADWYDLELDQKVSQLTSILEPVLIVFVGGVVALVALAVFMPIIGAIQTML